MPVTIKDIVETLPAHMVYAAPGYHDLRFTSILAGDLMSDILVSIEPGALLVTSLATDQALRSADMVCAPAVLLVNDKLPTLGMRALAEELEITLFVTPMPMYEACAQLSRIQDAPEENE